MKFIVGIVILIAFLGCASNVLTKDASTISNGLIEDGSNNTTHWEVYKLTSINDKKVSAINYLANCLVIV